LHYFTIVHRHTYNDVTSLYRLTVCVQCDVVTTSEFVLAILAIILQINLYV